GGLIVSFRSCWGASRNWPRWRRWHPKSASWASFYADGLAFLQRCGTAPRASAFEKRFGDIDMAVDQTALRHIGKLMHQHFDAIVSEPLPPRLHELVERLKVEPEAAKAQNAERPDAEEPIRLPLFRTAPA